MMKYLKLQGRINRIELLVLTLILFFFGVITLLAFDHNSVGFNIIISALFVCYLFQCAKRYHDLNKWGINGFVWFIIPIVNIFYFYELYLKKGTSGVNKYGYPSEFKLVLLKKKDNKTQQKQIHTETVSTSKDSIIKENNKMKNRISTAWVINWYIKDGAFCKMNDLICRVQYLSEHKQHEKKMIAESNGMLNQITDKIHFKTLDEINSESFYFIDSNLAQLNDVSIQYNGFNKSNNLTWNFVGGRLTDKYDLAGFIILWGANSERLFLSINYLNSKEYLVLRFPVKDFDCKINDKIEFLFEDEDVLSLLITESSFYHSNIQDFGINKLHEVKIPLTNENIKKLSTNMILEWRIVFSSRNEVRGKFNSNENSKPFFKIENAPPMVMNLAQSFLNEVINIKEYEPTIDFANDIEKEECYVYLMHDTTNNYYKIGISNNPNYRERTLQSEKPTIELIASKKFPSRLIVLSIEKALHESFKTKNIRGEWFNLNQSDVEDIIKTLI
ncbi:MAG: DUF805 domain-containing protein [Salinivirgaceae bacterium]|jgi:uncharacterized membrane protein YhaH (DUF805 family)/predicted GIY-YIG superfamily endonuclease|nr:DUF805 domain-containing protein [Salinivirgaceae bacterium]